MNNLLLLQCVLLGHAFVPGINNNQFSAMRHGINEKEVESLVGEPEGARKLEPNTDSTRTEFGLPLNLKAKDIEVNEPSSTHNFDSMARLCNYTQSETKKQEQPVVASKAFGTPSKLQAKDVKINEPRTKLDLHSMGKRSIETKVKTGPMGLCRSNLARSTNPTPERKTIRSNNLKSNRLQNKPEQVEKYSDVVDKEYLRFIKNISRRKKEEEDHNNRELRKKMLSSQEEYWRRRVKNDKTEILDTQNITAAGSQNQEGDSVDEKKVAKPPTKDQSTKYSTYNKDFRTTFLLEQEKRRAEIQKLKDLQMAKLHNINSPRPPVAQRVKESSLLERMVQQRSKEDTMKPPMAQRVKDSSLLERMVQQRSKEDEMKPPMAQRVKEPSLVERVAQQLSREDTMKQMRQKRNGFFRHYETATRLRRSRYDSRATRQRRSGFYRHYAM